jgi:tricarballylate dehydrogenase
VYESTDLPPERSDTVAGLAEALGLDPHRLEATVEEFNAECVAEGPGDWDPTRLDGNAASGLTPPKSNWAMPLVSPPFAGFPMTAQISSTFGGLRVDAHSRVLDAEGDAIPGLYAVGEITGHVHDRHLAATSVLRAMNFGRIVGQDVAASLPEPATGASGEASPARTTRTADGPPTRAWAGTSTFRE